MVPTAAAEMISIRLELIAGIVTFAGPVAAEVDAIVVEVDVVVVEEAVEEPVDSYLT